MSTSIEDVKIEMAEENQSKTDSKNISEIEENLRCQSPKYGTTLSTSTSSFEAMDPHDPNLSRLANAMFKKTEEYFQEELTAMHADYRIIERLNRETIAKYAVLKTMTTNVSQSLMVLNQKYKNLQPILEEINQINDDVSKLEQGVYKIAAYSKRLETKFQEMERENRNK